MYDVDTSQNKFMEARPEFILNDKQYILKGIVAKSKNANDNM